MKLENHRAFAVLESLPCILVLAGLALSLGAVYHGVREEGELSDALERCAREAALDRSAGVAVSCLEDALRSSGVSRTRWRALITDYDLSIDPRTGHLEGFEARGIYSAGAGTVRVRRSLPGVIDRSHDYAIPAAPLAGFFSGSRALVFDLFVEERAPLGYRIQLPAQ